MALRKGTPEYDAALAAAIEKGKTDIPRMRREIRRGGFLGVLQLAWATVWHMGMYSRDPYVARIATIHTAQEQIGIQRDIGAAHRLEDQANEIERARMLGRVQADAMLDRIEERRA